MASDRPIPGTPVKSKETAGLLMSVIRTLTCSADFTQREKEKSRIQKSHKDSDEKLEKLVSENYDDLSQIMTAFTKISDRISTSRERVQLVKQNLESCKNLLHCKRDDLRKLWLEGVEQKTVVELLDQIENLNQVPDKLELYMNKKQYLLATQLLVSSMKQLEGDLAGVEALRGLTNELRDKKEQLHEVLIDELNRQIYIKATSNVVKVFQRQGSQRKPSPRRGDRTQPDSDAATHRRTNSNASTDMKLLNEDGVPMSPRKIQDDQNVEPDNDQSKFIAILVNSLAVLKKLPEAIEVIKSKIHPELLAIVQRASQQVSDSAFQQGETGVLAMQTNSKYLVELLSLVYQEFHCVAAAHKVVLSKIDQLFLESLIDDDVVTYSMIDVWSEIQAVLQLVLGDYLDVRNTSSSQQQRQSALDEPGSDITTYFAKRRPAKPKKVALFRFDASSHAISMNSYLREQRQEFYGSGEILNRVDNMTEAGKQLYVCKPGANNITVIYNPLRKFIKEFEQDLRLAPGVSTLQQFIMEFENIFIGQVHDNISTNIHSATKSFDAFKTVTNARVMKDLGVSRPLLQSTVTVSKSICDLKELMHSLPDYAHRFIIMVHKILLDYKETCTNAYRGIVLSDTDDKRVISATWAKDEDINRLLRSLPNWQQIHSDDETLSEQQANISEEDMRALNSKESIILTSNLSTFESISESDIITDAFQLKALANLQESFEWFSYQIKAFIKGLPIVSAPKLTVPNQTIVQPEIPPVSDDIIRKLEDLSQEFLDLSEICLLVLHLEVRVHCFFFLLPVAKQADFSSRVDNMDPDDLVVKLTKDLSAIDENLSQSFQPKKTKYIFEGIGHLISNILVNSTQYLKRVNENGIKKMSRNIFSIQQCLTSITACREPDLDFARQHYELLYLKPDDILTTIMEQGPQFSEIQYVNIFQLLHRSQPIRNTQKLQTRLQRLKEILHEKHV
ncbi:exocyst complex component 4-like [Tubulanus polymorphus]|uniref:exocyst complex component 4-like n=1 Tax=Tubulanus polymorphus TaxID=672921 RepID=UPI003DA46B8A